MGRGGKTGTRDSDVSHIGIDNDNDNDKTLQISPLLLYSPLPAKVGRRRPEKDAQLMSGTCGTLTC